MNKDATTETLFTSKTAENIHSILRKYREEKFQHSNENTLLRVTRSTLWRDALTFYKTNMGDKQKLFQKLFVTFEGEDGIDAGALKIEFFTLVFNEAKKQLFESADSKDWLLIPKRAGGNLQIFKIFGMIIAHSLLQNGPFFNFLAPWVVDLLLNEEGTSGDLMLECIPLNCATGCLINFIQLLKSCESNDAINELFSTADGPAFEQIISSSDWDPNETVTMDNKDVLVNLLLHEETITRRGGKVRAMREGIIFMGFQRFLGFQAARNLFLGTKRYLDNEEFLSLFEWDESEIDPKRVECMAWLKNFVRNADQTKLRDLLKFCTGFEDVSSFCDKSIYIEFLTEEKLPKASVCTTTLHVPTGSSSEEEFVLMMTKALEFESVGFAEF